MLNLIRHNNIYNSDVVVGTFSNWEQASEAKRMLILLDSSDSWARYAHTYIIKEV